MSSHNQARRQQLRAILSTSTASLALLVVAGLPAAACPLGNHDSPRVRLLHAMSAASAHASHAGHRIQVAQGQPQTRMPARNELGAYARDLPRGAAAPTIEDKPPLFDKIDTHDPTALVGLPLIWLASVLRKHGFTVP